MAGSRYPSAAQTTAHDLSGGIGELRYDLTGADLTAAVNQFATGYRVADLRGYLGPSGDRYTVLFEQDRSTVKWTLATSLSGSDTDAQARLRQAEGKRPILFSGYRSSAGHSFAWVWDDVAGPVRALHRDLPIEQLHPHAERAANHGKRIVDLSVYENPFDPDPLQFTTIWDDDDGRTEWRITGPSDAAHSQTEFDSMTAAGWHIVRTCGYEDPAGIRFVTLWELAPATFYALSGVRPENLPTQLTDRDADGLRPEQLNPYVKGDPRVVRYCPLWRRRDADSVVPGLVADFARGYDLPAVSLAVARRGRLAYTYGHGDIVSPGRQTGAGGTWVDTPSGPVFLPDPPPPPRTVDPATTLFRVASLSKPITAAAVLRLVQVGLIHLDDRVFAPGGALAGFASAPADARIRDITVRHLLRHASGGWAATRNDPMWTHKDLSTDDLVRRTLADRPLDAAPGTTFAYSNFGYCLLGRLIEAVVGQRYERYLRSDLLLDCGAGDMRLATDAQPDGDVIRCYPAAGDEDPYQLRIDRMDAHGGWLASAVDMLRFAVNVDGREPDVVDPSSVAVMTTPSGLPNSDGYAAGWWINPAGSLDPDLWFHTGNLPGSTALMLRTPDDFSYVVLTNTNVRDTASPQNTVAALFRLLARIRGQVDYWPRDEPL